ncbi:MAG TPA: response regulator [Elusimicrobiota bacterium]|nr:response regulator [Elusimicrobiota bacterium]
MTESADANKKIVVVVVEDDHYILDFMKFTLEEQGYHVFGAADGEEGLSLIQSQLPLLVVLDLMLPKMDGFAILKRMSEKPETAHIPVVVVSAYTASESTRRMVNSQSNVKDIFTKPVRTKDFLEKLRTLIPS